MRSDTVSVLGLTATLLALALLIPACQLNSPARGSYVQDITYQWEPRAGLCFASLNSASYGANVVTSISHVPAAACGK